MSIAREGKLKAPPKQFRAVGVDTFEAPDADYLIGDFVSLTQAKEAADRRGQKMNPIYVYDDQGKLVHQAGASS
jgi:hypothetical protein